VKAKFVKQRKLKKALTYVSIITNFAILCFAMGILSMTMVPCKLTDKECQLFNKDGTFDVDEFEEFWKTNKQFFFWVNHIAALGLLLLIIPFIYFFHWKQ
jgi:hypothetical protein